MASLIILDIVAELKRRGRSLSQLIAGISRYCNSGEINFRVEDKPAAMEAVLKHFTSGEKPSALMDFDGYRVEFPQWWLNIRPSNTEPYLRSAGRKSRAGQGNHKAFRVTPDVSGKRLQQTFTDRHGEGLFFDIDVDD